MPVRRFRSIEEMKVHTEWLSPGDPALSRRIRALWDFGQRTGVHRFPHGVYKHRSLEELNAQTEKWNEANFKEHQRRRRLAAETEP